MKIVFERDKDTLDIAHLLRKHNITKATYALDEATTIVLEMGHQLKHRGC